MQAVIIQCKWEIPNESEAVFINTEILLKYIDEKSILGFTNEKRYIPIIMSLLFLSVVQKKDAQIINNLADF